MTTTLYGIKNCDSVKRARAWLDAAQIPYRFHDFRQDGLSAELLDGFEAALGWEALLNQRGTTWRKLDASQRHNLDRDTAIALMLAQPSLIKRPVLQIGAQTLLGFSPDAYQQLL